MIGWFKVMGCKALGIPTCDARELEVYHLVLQRFSTQDLSV